MSTLLIFISIQKSQIFSKLIQFSLTLFSPIFIQIANSNTKIKQKTNVKKTEKKIVKSFNTQPLICKLLYTNKYIK